VNVRGAANVGGETTNLRHHGDAAVWIVMAKGAGARVK
jgi:hypothetical protein